LALNWHHVRIHVEQAQVELNSTKQCLAAAGGWLDTKEKGMGMGKALLFGPIIFIIRHSAAVPPLLNCPLHNSLLVAFSLLLSPHPHGNKMITRYVFFVLLRTQRILNASLNPDPGRRTFERRLPCHTGF
jgi:hypothetical protein